MEGTTEKGAKGRLKVDFGLVFPPDKGGRGGIPIKSNFILWIILSIKSMSYISYFAGMTVCSETPQGDERVAVLNLLHKGAKLCGVVWRQIAEARMPVIRCRCRYHSSPAHVPGARGKRFFGLGWAAAATGDLERDCPR
jgi:hypothetical protein